MSILPIQITEPSSGSWAEHIRASLPCLEIPALIPPAIPGWWADPPSGLGNPLIWAMVAAKLEENVVRPGDTLLAMGTLGENSSTVANFLSPEAAELEREQELGGVMLPAGAVVAPKLNAVNAAQFDAHPKMALGGAKDRPLFFSVRSQREIVQDLTWKSALYIWGGPILTLLCFWYLLGRLGY